MLSREMAYQTFEPLRRLAAAQVLREKAGQSLMGCQILVKIDLPIFFNLSPTFQVDPMTDIANLSYGALPERLYVVLDGTIVYEVRQVHLTDPVINKLFLCENIFKTLSPPNLKS